MQHVYYNSWMNSYKNYFGAVPENQTVTFRIRIPLDNIQQVQFMIRKEDGTHGRESYQMQVDREGMYAFTYTFSQGSGLYFYYFYIQQGLPGGAYAFYYGSINGFGGEGRIYGDEQEVSTYQVTCFEKAEATPAWYRQGICYQIFPDRFFNGNPHELVTGTKKNSFIYGRKEDTPYYIKNGKGEIVRWDFYGGNLKGIIAKIPYLKSLGISILYLNPIFLAQSNHRYDTADYMAIDSMLGDEAIFKELLETLHNHEMYLILDGVFSHVGMNSRYFNYDGSFDSLGAYQSKASPYYDWFTFTEYPEKYKAWWGVEDLPEIKKENRNYQEFIFGDVGSVLTKWNKLGVDGWRLDVADELPDEFIFGIRQNLENFSDKVLIGEVWEDASKKIAYDKRRQYILGNMLHGVMNYPLRENVLRLLKKTATPETIAREFMTLRENYPRDVFYNLLNNIGTHDTKRILTELQEDVSLLASAVGLMMMMPGVPCVYYGDEAGLVGEADPDNRRFYPWGRENKTIFEIYKNWLDLRQDNLLLIEGRVVYCYTQHFFGVARYLEVEDGSRSSAVFLVNTSNDPQTIHIDDFNLTGDYPFQYQSIHELFEGKVIEGNGCYYQTF